MEGDWPSLQLSLVFRECSGGGEQRQWFNPGRLSGEADFDVSSKGARVELGWLACALDKDASHRTTAGI